MKHFIFAFSVMLMLAGSSPLFAQTKIQTQSIEQADQLRDEKSFQQAAAIYKNVLKDSELSPSLIKELQFKWADASWRSGVANNYEDAVKMLQEVVAGEDHERWWAEGHESLAEHFIKVDRYSHQNEIKQSLEHARGYWAGSSDIELARSRFIKVSFTLGEFISQHWGWVYRDLKPTKMYHGNILPDDPNRNGLQILYEEILEVAKSDEDRARVYYSLAMSYYHNYNHPEKRKLTKKYFNKIIKDFPESEWLDDAYYYLGQNFEQNNELKKAVKVYQDFLKRYGKGESKWVNDASRRLAYIIAPQLSVSSSYTFVPDSDIQFNMSWRNISEANISLYDINLLDHLVFDQTKSNTDSKRGVNNYQDILKRVVESNKHRSLKKVMNWKVALKDEGNYQHYSENKSLAHWLVKNKNEVDPKKSKLKPGAYLLLAESGDQKAFDLVLVTDLGVVSKTAGNTGLIFAFDSKTGAPLPSTDVKYQYRYHDDTGNWQWVQEQGQTDEEGLLKINFKNGENRNYGKQHQLFVTLKNDDMQAFVQGNYYAHYGQNNQWWFYAYTDRPAYRPTEEVSFKGVLRNYQDKGFETPSFKRVKALVYDARGNKVMEKVYSLNEFGSFNDKFNLDEKATLGEYRLELYTEEGNTHLGQAVLFRLEEYKLPEFLVDITPKKEEGQTLTYQLGDTIDIELNAEYYFGGGVSNAEVEYLVYQSPYYHYYYPMQKYPWYYDQLNPSHRSQYYNKQLITQETIKTDEHGKAFFNFQSPENGSQDLIYHIEARVVDQSRREIRANATIKVTKQGFYAYLKPKQNLYRPGDRAEVDIKTLTANNEPIAVDGKVTVSRHWWKQAVIHNEKTTHPAQYDKTELFTKFAKTNELGEVVFAFEPDQDGYYIVEFTGFDAKGQEVKSQTNVFVCATSSKDIGFQYNGLQIISEKETYAVGEIARVMLVANKPDTWVLFSQEADEIFDYKMLHLDGNVKLVEFEVKDYYTPNMFLNAVSAENYQLKLHNLSLIVPPDEKFLNIKIISDKETYSPGEEGNFEIELTDKNGDPVQGEMSLGLVDASVYYIQSELAKDIREFFYGKKRAHSVQTQASFHQRSYQRFDLFKRDNNGEDDLDEKEGNKRVGGYQARVMYGKGMVAQEMLASAPIMADSIEESFRSDGRFGNRLEQKKRSGDKLSKSKSEIGGEDADLDSPKVRQDFRSTIIWQPTLITDENGRAHIKVTFPDSLTTWKTTARSITQHTQVGTVTHEVKTKKDIIVRLQAPRFFTERDEVVISANVHNYTDEEKKIKVTIKADGLDLKDKASLWINVAAQGEQRVDWKTIAVSQGMANITVMAQTEKDSDAMVKSYPVIPHGIEKFLAQSLELKSQGLESFQFDVPRERIKESTSLQINLSPSLAGAMLDALPYLAQYPYGCVEQTMSRFLPAIIVRKTLRELGLSQREVSQYINNVLIPREDPEGHPKRSSQATLSELNKMTNSGLDRIYDFQHSDGGWGWWKEGRSDRFMSAYVVWGLSLAKDAGMKIKGNAYSRGIDYLKKELVEEEDNPDMLAWMLHALAATKSRGEFQDKQSTRLWDMREELNPYTRALFALAEHYHGNKDRALVLARNLANGMNEQQSNNTVYWGESGVHYRWSEGGVEATAFVIKALSNIMPDSELIAPAVRWMALNRRGARWKNTRDTAIAILGLADYLKTTNELTPDFEYQVTVNGKQVQTGHVDRKNLFSFNRIIQLDAESIKNGNNQVEVKLQGAGALYVSGYLKYFTLEENISAEGNEVYVTRKYYKQSTKPTLLKGYSEDWKLIKSGAEIKSGDRIRVEILLDSKNNYEYLIVEDYKPAGLEAVELKSGSTYAEQLDYKGRDTNHRTWVYQELRDQKAVFFVDKLKTGQHRLRYELRAEIPGTFHGMPNQTHAMYVPEIRANSSEVVVSVRDKQ